MRRTFLLHHGIPTRNLSPVILILGSLLLWLPYPPTLSHAQVPPITSSGLNTQVSDPIAVGGQTQYDITGGTRPGGGANLFHSFGDFSVPTNNIANFLNAGSIDLNGNVLTPNLPTSNILGRVTGGDPSVIFGMIQTNGPNGFGNANLFLMNPAGFLFGPDAMVNVGGMVTFTSADYLRLADHVRFNAVPNAATDALLSTVPVVAYGFLGSDPGAITVQGSQFSVTDGQSISLVGGTITIKLGTPDGGIAQPAHLSAPNGKILLASAASPGEFDATTLQAVDGASFTSFGSVSLAPGSLADVSGAGKISIRGGAFTLEVKEALLSTEAIPSLPGGDTLDSISLTGGSAIATATAGEEAAADVQLAGRSISLDGASITSITTGKGASGAITVSAEDSVSLTGGAQIVSRTEGNGIGGNITVEATSETGSVTISGFDLDGTIRGTFTPFLANPLTGEPIVVSGIYSLTSGSKPGGNISITAPTVSLQEGAVVATVTSGDATGGNVSIFSDTFEITSGASLLSSAGQDFTAPDFVVSGTGGGGNIIVSATDSVTISGGSLDLFALSNISTQTYNPVVDQALDQGHGGAITVSAPNIILEDAGSIFSGTQGSGAGGAVNIFAFNHLSLSGFSQDLGTASSIGSFSSGTPSGNGGAIQVTAPSVTIEDGGLIATDISSIGNGGDISLTVDDLTLRNGGSIASSSSSDGSSGHIQITAMGTLSISGQFIDPNNPGAGGWSAIKNSADEGSSTRNGGIDIHAGKLIMKDGPLNATSVFGLGIDEAQIYSTTGSPAGGTIRIIADDSISMSSNARILNRKGSFESGSIALEAPSISLDRSAIHGRTNIDRDAGAITLTATAGNLTLSNDSHVLTSTLQSSGTAGPIIAEASDSILLSGGSTIESSSTSAATGDGGSITLNAANQITLSGTGTALRSTTAGSGDGGTVTVNANQVQLNNGGLITASTTGAGDGGSITIAADSTFVSNASTVSSTATQAQGGDIKITAGQSATPSNGSSISASSTGPGNAGNITIEGLASPAESVLIDGPGSGIFTDTQGTGAGGNIFVNANSVTLQNGGRLSAETSGHEVTATGGNITIQASDVQLKTGAIVTADTSGSGAGGKVMISADQRITVTDSYILTSAVPESGEGGAGGDIVLNAPTLSLEGSGLFASTSSIGRAGDVALQGEQITLASNTVVATSTDGQGAAGTIRVEGLQGPGSRATIVTLSNSRIESETTGNVGSEGPAGNIFLETARLTLTDSQLSTRSSFSPGNAGQLVVNAIDQIQLVRSNITSSSEGAVTDVVTGDPLQTGDAGQIIMQAPHILVEDASKVTTNTEFTGQAGNITLNTANLEVRSGAQITSSSSALESSPTGNAGTVTVQDLASPAQSVLIDGAGSGIVTNTEGTGAGGNIFVNANSVTLQNGGTLSAATSGTAPTARGGTITVEGNRVQLNSAATITTATSGPANAGEILVRSDTFSINEGATISAQSTGSGNAGNVTIQGLVNPAQSVLIDGPGSGIVTDTQATGAGGNIFVNANSVTLQNGGRLSAATSGTAASATGGTITVDATNTVTMNRASITASSTGVADAGSIDLTAMNGFSMQNSTITTQAGQGAGGGNIKVSTSPEATVLLQNSLISASVADGRGGGGNISIDPQFVILQNSQILAQAAQGQGGAITIIANLFLPDANSIVNADSGSGVNGTVTIQSPNAPISGQIQPLGKTPLIATSLLNQHCSSLAGGEFSSFTVAGRDSLPTEPGGWLASPLATLSVGTGLGVKAEGERLKDMSAGAGQVDSGQWRMGDIQILSLRRIAPAGFLTQAFAVEGAASCQS